MAQTYYQKINSGWKKMTMRGITGKGVKIFVLDSKDEFGNDVFGHGSIVGSIIKSDIGLATGCELYYRKVITDPGSLDLGALIDNMQYARANGADVISLSLRLGSYIQAMQDEINLCAAADISIYAACGNSSTLEPISYPAGGLNVIAVNSVDPNGVAAHKSVIASGTGITHGVDICWGGFFPSEALNKNGVLVNTGGTSISAAGASASHALIKEYLGYPSNKVVEKYMLNRALKQTDTQLYGKGLLIY